jgi:integrase/recombinase XerD
MGKAQDWASAFLEMMAVERSAARNTLTAYAKDLEDASAFLVSKDSGLDSA